MWATRNGTPYVVDRNWVRDKDGAHHWVVSVKATLKLDTAGRLRPDDEQVPLVLAPEWNGEDGASSLRYESELGLLRPGTDVTVNGQAFAPNGRPVPEVPIALRVGPLKKVLLVRGTNMFHSAWSKLSTTAPAPFVTMPVVYERAFGGSDLSSPDPKQQKLDTRNPVGVGVAASPAKIENTPGPNVVYPGQDLATAGPAGFGAIASHWSPRREHAGTYDAVWEQTRMPLLAADWDPRSLLSAPPDQRPGGYLQGGEQVEVVNMSERGVFRFEIPRFRFVFTTYFGSRSEQYGGLLTSVVIEPEVGRVLCTWQSQLKVSPSKLDYLDYTEVEAQA